MNRHRIPRAVHGDANCIRVHFDQEEAPAVAFSELALPGALVSWAYSQLSSLDTLLESIAMGDSDEGGSEVAEAARSFLRPALNALVYSETRAHELQCESAASPLDVKKPTKEKCKRSAPTSKSD